MSKKWIYLACVLSLGSVETSQAHPLDSRDIVYIDGSPCNSACQSYMAWSRQTLSASGHQAPTQLRPRPASGVAHRATTAGRQVRVARQAVPLPPSRIAMSGKSDGPPDKLGAEANFNATKAMPEHAATAPAQQATAATVAPPPEQKSNNDDAAASSRSEIVPPGDVEKTGSAPPDNVSSVATLPAGEAAADSNTRTPREQVTAVAEPVTAAAAVPAPDQKADSGDPSDRSETIGLGDTKKAESAPSYKVARLDPAGGAVADSNTGTIQQQVTAATVIAEHVVTLRDAEKAASGSPSNTDQMVVVLIARPEINAISDLTGKDIAIDDRYSASSDKVRTAIAAAGAVEVQLSEGQTRAIERLTRGEVPAAVLTLLYPETGFPQFAGFKIFRIPLVPRSPTARL